MSSPLRLIIFDVDGTLVDSQGDIIAAMTHAFDSIGQPVPERAAILGIVGLSLDVAMPRLAPQLSRQDHAALVEGYKASYKARRVSSDTKITSPLYPHALETLRALNKTPDYLLGVATGKSNRGLRGLIESHGFDGMFVTRQTADDHPSKPNPSMLLAALAETGVEADNAVMIGDTSFDMEMAQAAGITSIGVSWGYHPREALGKAACIIDDFRDLNLALNTLWR